MAVERLKRPGDGPAWSYSGQTALERTYKRPPKAAPKRKDA